MRGEVDRRGEAPGTTASRRAAPSRSGGQRQIAVTALGSSSVDLEVRVRIADAGREKPIYVAVMEASKLALDAAGIEIPFPHLQLFVEQVEQRVWEQAERLRQGAS